MEKPTLSVINQSLTEATLFSSVGCLSLEKLPRAKSIKDVCGMYVILIT